MRNYQYFAPTSWDELFGVVQAQADTDVVFLAGGTDLVPRINMERDELTYEAQPTLSIVALAALGLSGISDEGDKIVIGSGTKIVDLQDSALLREKAPALCQAADQLASYAVRNSATLAGNVINASPAADMVPPLMVLDADIALKSAAGERTIKIVDFMTGPGKTAIAAGEVITAITIYPKTGKNGFSKLGRRAAETLSVINAAAYVEVKDGVCVDATIVVGSAAPTAKVCTAAAEALIGQAVDEATVKAAMAKVNEALCPIDDIRASAWYRLETAPVIAARAVMAAVGQA